MKFVYSPHIIGNSERLDLRALRSWMYYKLLEEGVDLFFYRFQKYGKHQWVETLQREIQIQYREKLRAIKQ